MNGEITLKRDPADDKFKCKCDDLGCKRSYEYISKLREHAKDVNWPLLSVNGNKEDGDVTIRQGEDENVVQEPDQQLELELGQLHEPNVQQGPRAGCVARPQATHSGRRTFGTLVCFLDVPLLTGAHWLFFLSLSIPTILRTATSRDTKRSPTSATVSTSRLTSSALVAAPVRSSSGLRMRVIML